MTLYSACIEQSGARAASILFAVIPAAAGVMAWAALGEQLSSLTIAGLVRGAAACVLRARSGGPAGRRASGERDHAAERPALARSAE